MKRFKILGAAVSVVLMGSAAWAGEAETSASAGRGIGRPETASATAHYEGKVGFARTTTETGKLNLARGVAVGVDKDGVTISVSNAIAPKFGPAIATSFNLSIDRDGDVSKSSSLSIARGPLAREASAGGGVSNGPGGAATAFAGGKTDPLGRVDAWSRSSKNERLPFRGERVRVMGR